MPKPLVSACEMPPWHGSVEGRCCSEVIVPLTVYRIRIVGDWLLHGIAVVTRASNVIIAGIEGRIAL